MPLPVSDLPRPGVSPRERRLALLLVCLFAVAVSTAYTNHGPLLGLIQAELGLSSADAGAIATAFFLGGGVTMFPGGLLADRLGARRLLIGGFLVAALANIGQGLLAPGFGPLLAWRFVGGMGAGAAFAAGAAYTRGIFEGRGAHLAQGLYGASFLLGSGSTLLFMPLLAGESGDWRTAFVLAGIGVTAVWAAWALLAPPGPGAVPAHDLGVTVSLRRRNTWLLALCHSCGFGMAMVLGTWVTTYLVRGFALPLAQAGALGSLVLAMGIAGRSLGGVILERGVPPARLIRGALTLTVAGFVVMALPGSLPVALGGILVTGLGVGLPYAAVFNGAAVSVPESPAAAQALVGWGGTLTAVVGPPVVGALLDTTGSFAAGYLVLAAFVLVVLASTRLLRPIAFEPRRLG